MRRIVPLLACSLAAPMAQAAGPSISEVLVNSGISVAGHASGSYTVGFNKGQTLALRAFDTESDSFTFNQAWLNVGYQPADGFGGVATLMAGSDASVVNGSYTGSTSSDFSLVQGFAQYASGPFTLMAGRFVTLSGFEVIDDTANTNISRSLLFQNAEPLVHTGVRTAFKAGPATLYLGASNSALAGTVADNNKEKTGEFGVSIAPTSAFSISAYDYYGIDGGNKNNLLDVVMALQATPMLQLALNADWARFIGAGATVAGLAAYANVTWSDSFKTSLRGEYVRFTNVFAPNPPENNCPDGSGKCNVYEVTLTGDYSASKNFDVLVEGRLDSAKGKIFPNGGDPAKKTQPDVAIKAIYKFGTPTGS
jgi:hypothetical protein